MSSMQRLLHRSDEWLWPRAISTDKWESTYLFASHSQQKINVQTFPSYLKKKKKVVSYKKKKKTNIYYLSYLSSILQYIYKNVYLYSEKISKCVTSVVRVCRVIVFQLSYSATFLSTRLGRFNLLTLHESNKKKNKKRKTSRNVSTST